MVFRSTAGFLAVVLMLLSFRLDAQDPEFTQFYAAPLYLNPAYAGTKDIRIHMNFRDQWPALPQAYVTLAVGYDQHIDKMSGGIGLIAISDRAGNGVYLSNRVSAMYSYQLNVSRKFALHFGLEASFVQKSIDWEKLNFSDQIHPIFGFYDPGNNPYQTNEPLPPGESFSYLDFSAGILGYSENMYFGVAVNHLTEPVESLYNDASSTLPMRYVAHFGFNMNYGMKSDKSTFFSPNIMVTSQDNFNQLNIGSYVNKGPVFGGFWYRHTLGNSDAMIALVGMKLPYMKIGYSFDFSLSELIAYSGGSHELSMVMEFKHEKKRNNKRQLYCPSGF